MDLFLPAEERREILKQYGQKHGLHVFIETGTNAGETPWYLKDYFKQLYTIELDRLMHSVAKRLFEYHPQVTCLQGDSTEVLPLVLASISEPALVWLDGHYCGPGSAHGEHTSTPIEQELRILFDDGRPHVILVDDARIFKGGPEHEMYAHYSDYPTLQWVEELALAHGYSYELEDDIVRLVPRAAV